MEKIIQFLRSKIVKTVSTCLFIVSVTSLIIGGVSEAELSSALKAIFQVAGAVAGLIAIVSQWIPIEKK